MASGAVALTADINERARPVTLAREQVLPVIAPLTTLLPNGLVRGTTVAVDGVSGVTSLVLALAAGASQEGSWVAAVGVPWLGLAAAAECGVVLDRLAVVSLPERSEWATVVAALIDAIDVVLVCPPQRVAMGDARRLAARARERGAVLLVVGATSSLTIDVRCTVSEPQWAGVDHGAGHLQSRRVMVSTTGRGSAARPRSASLWLPGPDGQVATCAEVAEVTPLVRAEAG
jgi:hypothetical protein